MEIVLPLEHAMPSKKLASNREAHFVLEFVLEDKITIVLVLSGRISMFKSNL